MITERDMFADGICACLIEGTGRALAPHHIDSILELCQHGRTPRTGRSICERRGITSNPLSKRTTLAISASHFSSLTYIYQNEWAL